MIVPVDESGTPATSTDATTPNEHAQVGERIWLVTFMQYDLGYFDDEACRLNRSRIRSDRKCYLSARNKVLPVRSE